VKPVLATAVILLGVLTGLAPGAAAHRASYVLKHRSAPCRAHYRKQTRHVRRHGKRVTEIVCVYVAPRRPRPQPVGGSTGPTSVPTAPAVPEATNVTIALAASIPGGPGTMDVTIKPTVATAGGFTAGASTVEIVDETTSSVLATYLDNNGDTGASGHAASPITSLELTCNLNGQTSGNALGEESCTPIGQHALVSWPGTDKVAAVATFGGVPGSATSAGYAPSTSTPAVLPVIAVLGV
jgi:hypothetical protein